MSLGVLNNIAAMSAENALNNTSNSLNTVLQQLSTGSRINSGADDAAGLSLINGLQANSTALAQSQTNATEGVGLLQVADGALSQVTSLLNRAVTLATEASNGTLNGTQDAAANQEYQSILSEISNIGSTTTYNQNAVFGSNTGIYTGDSSTTGASIDQLSIGGLSSSDLGQTNGQMSYSSGQSVFVDLSTATVNAQSTDAVTAGSSLTVTYDVGSTSGPVTATATIATGGTTGYANTVEGMIQAINGSGLGLTASFSTAGAAGDAAPTNNSSDTGIMITGDVQITAPTATGQTEVAQGTTALADTSAGTAAVAAGTTGTATISYTAGNGQDLSTTNLSTSTAAKSALTAINTAISDVAAQDGYVGAQINTLNSVSSVLSTQQQNVTSAQNAVQATNYATATSDMSKYEILSQTGISALAQANSVQQEVTKLLQ
ncbi:flagellin N-terminal helical domain-containing protein [Acidicapsa acidisoli]|uniref:flagellin N-terminal helical domain-containing protein n=1 Tax=Acidicapsa acidisoli TaxID=1615681 RepID=UPI0021DF70D7|nr:flagellin [Acidicapsa acidisoli]